jgi:hypothetical protein
MVWETNGYEIIRKKYEVTELIILWKSGGERTILKLFWVVPQRITRTVSETAIQNLLDGKAHDTNSIGQCKQTPRPKSRSPALDARKNWTSDCCTSLLISALSHIVLWECSRLLKLTYGTISPSPLEFACIVCTYWIFFGFLHTMRKNGTASLD